MNDLWAGNTGGNGKVAYSEDDHWSYNKCGRDKSGYDDQGYYKSGYSRHGYGKRGYNKKGHDKNCDDNVYNRSGYSWGGYDKRCKEGDDKKYYNMDHSRMDSGHEMGVDEKWDANGNAKYKDDDTQKRDETKEKSEFLEAFRTLVTRGHEDLRKVYKQVIGLRLAVTIRECLTRDRHAIWLNLRACCMLTVFLISWRLSR